MTDRRGVVAKRAENLPPGVPYVRGWNRARQSAGALADQLVLLGLDSDFPGLAADVNVFGDGLVQLGTVLAEAAGRLALQSGDRRQSVLDQGAEVGDVFRHVVLACKSGPCSGLAPSPADPTQEFWITSA
ncbi:hypothetical protein [Streptomyces sp. NPDC057616]|uniref:hypothetical protein n=1 Tax=Streptomyces sp. NPDC057616 TaxID=3346183 RepID=UPI0036B2E920